MANAPPVIANGGLLVPQPGATVSEGTRIAFADVFNDAGSDDTHAFAWTVTNRFGIELPEFAENGNTLHGDSADYAFTPELQGQYTVTFRVTDDDGALATSSVHITVVNVEPRIQQFSVQTPEGGETVMPGGSTSVGLVGEADEVVLSADLSDPGDAGWSYIWSVVSDNGQIVPNGMTSALSFTPENEGNYDVTLTVLDDDGAAVEPVAKPGVPVDPLLEYLREFQEDDMLDDIAEQIGRQWLR